MGSANLFRIDGHAFCMNGAGNPD